MVPAAASGAGLLDTLGQFSARSMATLVTQPGAPEAKKLFIEKTDNPVAIPAVPKHTAALQAAGDGVDTLKLLDARLKADTGPLLLLVGEMDDTFRKSMDALAAARPGQRRTDILGAGHMQT